MSDIEWTGETWNAVAGCSQQSPGCAHCYAMSDCHRFAASYRDKPGLFVLGANVKKPGLTWVPTDPTGRSLGKGAQWTGEIRCMPHRLTVPIKRRMATTYFVNSVSDIFHKTLVASMHGRRFIAAMFGVMVVTPQHTYQLLTKQPEAAIGWFSWIETASHVAGLSAAEYCVLAANDLLRLSCEQSDDPMWSAADAIMDRWTWATTDRLGLAIDEDDARSIKRTIAKLKLDHAGDIATAFDDGAWPRKNIQIGVSVEDVQRKNRIDLLRLIPAALRFISFEPLLEDLGEINLAGIGWSICGGESGAKARPCAGEWLLSIVDQCRAQDCPAFVKQLGAYSVSTARACDTVEDAVALFGEAARKNWPASRWLWRAGTADAKGGDMSEWPKPFQVRMMPGDKFAPVAPVVEPEDMPF